MYIRQTASGYERFHMRGNLAGTGIDKNNLAASGISEIPDPARPDDRYYYVSDLNTADTPAGPWFTSTAKDLVQLKETLIGQIKQQAGGLLSISDWKIVRESEGIKPCDQATKDYRAAVRVASDANEALVTACTTVDELIAVVQTWPQDPNSPTL